MVYVACHKADLNYARYAILDGIADLLRSTSDIWEAAGILIYYTGMKVKKLYKFAESSFLGEEPLNAWGIPTLWNPFFN